jgi:tetraacyldisaccharide 4'-kinase
MREALQRAWLRRGALAWLLWPASLVFGLAVAVRRALLSRTRVGVPVVVVGNVVVGGAGKTPVVIALLEHLARRGLAAGVVSRGYGRETQDCREVGRASRAHDVGDEPLLVKRRTDVPVFVAADRGQAARALLAQYPQVQVIVSDDGLQHYALARDIEVCVFDERGTGNGFLLPAGPLRERWPRKVDLVLGLDGHRVARRLAPWAQRADGTRLALADLALQGRPIKAIAGIANPEAFFAMLRAQGLEIAAYDAPEDHYDFAQLRPAHERDYTLVCTEKDAVKLWQQRPDAWAVPLAVDIEAGFYERLDRLLDAKLHSAHGSETA